MLERNDFSQATCTLVFQGEEDDVIDQLLAILRQEKWENLVLHYELGHLTAERTHLHLQEQGEGAVEVPITLALSVSWIASVSDVEIMLEINDAEQEWTSEQCQEICSEIMTGLSKSFATNTAYDAETADPDDFADVDLN